MPSSKKPHFRRDYYLKKVVPFQWINNKDCNIFIANKLDIDKISPIYVGQFRCTPNYFLRMLKLEVETEIGRGRKRERKICFCAYDLWMCPGRLLFNEIIYFSGFFLDGDFFGAFLDCFYFIRRECQARLCMVIV
jgi:hypothetical protein